MINDILDVEIIDLTYLGYGLCKVEDFSIFVENALPNELIKIKINRVDKRFAFGEIVEILKGSEDRIEPKDSNQTQFGTMPLQHLSYNKQLEFKKKMVMDSLSKFMDVNSLNIKDPIGMEFPWQYRNKAQVPVRHVDGNLQTGFFKRETHDLIPVENYLIQEKEIDKAILIVRDILRKFNISAYDEEQHEGLIRHLIIRRGHHSKELMIVMVTRLKDLPRREEIVKAILEALPNTVSIIQNINSKKMNVILGHQQKILFGDDIYFDTILDLKFGISSKSFYQVNSIQTEKLYAKALEFAIPSFDISKVRTPNCVLFSNIKVLR